ncbi:MAG: Holliday junction resolvase RuvX [Chloroflexi bacterium]|nr:Holliday junction resolvase RuvX [Chloroflexota bacterium]
MSGYFIGLDLGRARVGISISDPTCLIAQPYKVIKNKAGDMLAGEISALLEGRELRGLVAGLPLNADGSAGKAAIEAEKKAGEIASALGVPLYMEDERYTTLEAEEILQEGGLNWKRRKGKKDKVAAALILQSFLDRKGWL